MPQKLFSEKQVDISAILAGPVPPGILIYQNYKALGKDKEAYITLGGTIIFTILFFFGIFQLPEEIIDRVPNFLFTAFYGLIVFAFFRHFLAKDVNEAFENGAIKKSNWSVAGLTILGLGINLGIIFGLVVDRPFYDGEVIKVHGNQLYHDASIPMTEINKFSVQLVSYDFFGDNYGNIARLQLSDDGYQITLVVDEQFWNDQEIIISLGSLKLLMESEFKTPTKLKLESVPLSGNSKFKEL